MKVGKRHQLGRELWERFNVQAIKKREASQEDWTGTEKNIRGEIAESTDSETDFLRKDQGTILQRDQVR